MTDSGSDPMLPWISKSLSKYSTLTIENLSSSWNDGIAFCAVVDAVSPGIIEVADLSQSERERNITLAFEKAEEFLGYPPTADTTEDILSQSEVTEEIVSGFLYAFSDSFPQTLDQFTESESSISKPAEERKVTPGLFLAPGIGRESALNDNNDELNVKKLSVRVENASPASSPTASPSSSPRLCPSLLSKSPSLEDDRDCHSQEETPEQSNASAGEASGESVSRQQELSSPNRTSNEMESSQESASNVAVSSAADETITSAIATTATEPDVSAATPPSESANTTSGPAAASDVIADAALIASAAAADVRTSPSASPASTPSPAASTPSPAASTPSPAASTPSPAATSSPAATPPLDATPTSPSSSTTPDVAAAALSLATTPDTSSVPTSSTPTTSASGYAGVDKQSAEPKTPRESVVSKAVESPVPASSAKKRKAPAPKPPSGPDGTIQPQANVAPGSCNMCGEVVFEMERQEVEGILIHRKCLRCHVCHKILQEQSYEIMRNRFTCQQHYRQMRRRVKSSNSMTEPPAVAAAAPQGASDEAPTASIKAEVEKLKGELNIRAGSVKRKRTAPLPPSSSMPAVSRSNTASPAPSSRTTTPSPSVTPVPTLNTPGSAPGSPSLASKNLKKRAPLPPSALAGSKPPAVKSMSTSAIEEQQQQRRRKPKAPPPPDVRQRHSQRVINEETLSLADIEKKLAELDVQQQVLEEVAAQLENLMSDDTDQDAALNDKLSIKMEVLKSKKAALVSEENYLVYLRMDMELVKERADLEAAMRDLMEKDASEKTVDDQEREQAIVDEIVALVEERNRLLESLECDEDEPAPAPALSAAAKSNASSAVSTPKPDRKAMREETKRMEKERKQREKLEKQESKERKEREKQAAKEQKAKDKLAKKSSKGKSGKEPADRTDSGPTRVSFFYD